MDISDREDQLRDLMKIPDIGKKNHPKSGNTRACEGFSQFSWIRKSDPTGSELTY